MQAKKERRKSGSNCLMDYISCLRTAIIASFYDFLSFSIHVAAVTALNAMFIILLMKGISAEDFFVPNKF